MDTEFVSGPPTTSTAGLFSSMVIRPTEDRPRSSSDASTSPFFNQTLAEL